ncbi:hypothetical protein QVD17_16950 [Tagetes erecta]|uniref:Glycosyltransferase n=1 Tax=Tagetes erecta TaxID=13708 RepID=A0AAD8KS80_TARER|nr:hypothetical protein QVD17_16950 [Tagetes erecta]
MVNVVANLIFIPVPGIGHIMSAVEVAKLFVNRDPRLSATVLVIKPPISSSGSAITTYIESLAKNSIDRVSFVELPQDEAPPMRELKSLVTSFNDFIKSHSKHVRNVVTELMSQEGFGRLAGFVVDMFCSCMMDVANEFNVATYVFFTSNAAFLAFKLFIPTLNDDENQDVVELSKSNIEISVPGFLNPVPTKVFWSVLQTREGLEFAISSAKKLKKVKAIMVNTFLEFETHAIKSLSADINVPTVYPVGPILNLEGGSGKPLDDDVIRWLDSQPTASVVLLCFGSMGSFDEVQVKEIALALEHSGYRFVWSLRRPPSDGTTKVPGDYEDPRAVLPEGFLERTNGIGKVIGWAPQVALLAHRAVGGFVSHCGWNSLLESLWFGVPVATWPVYAEQQMNAFEMVVELGLAVKIRWDYLKDLLNPEANTIIVSANEIESGIRQVMEDKEVRRKVKEMSKKSRVAMAAGGSSYTSISTLIQEFIRNIS